MEPSWVAWSNASGTAKDNLAYIANKAKDHWFGHWNPNDKIASQVHDYIANSQDGDKDALVQMAIFRVVPWEHDACNRLPTAAERASYRQWIDRFAGAVGNTPTAIVLQPDGPFALCAPGGSHVPSDLVAYASRVLSAQPNTSVYIEAGASDWPMFGPEGRGHRRGEDPGARRHPVRPRVRPQRHPLRLDPGQRGAGPGDPQGARREGVRRPQGRDQHQQQRAPVQLRPVHRLPTRPTRSSATPSPRRPRSPARRSASRRPRMSPTTGGTCRPTPLSWRRSSSTPMSGSAAPGCTTWAASRS